MSRPLRSLAMLFLFILPAALIAGAQTTSPAATITGSDDRWSGDWDATVVVHGDRVPFHFALLRDGAQLRASFFDGDRPVDSAPAAVSGTTLHLEFSEYATVLDLTLRDGHLQGSYRHPRSHKAPDLVFAATRAGKTSPSEALRGSWELWDEQHSYVGKLIVWEKSNQLSGAVLRPDGDSRTLTGSLRNGHLALSHFAGDAPTLLAGELDSAGRLALVAASGHGRRQLRALSPEQARAEALPAPPNPYHTVRVKRNDDAFAFAFPAPDGTMFSSRDPRLVDKVVLISISGSWCPNCNDEAELLRELYQRHHSEGLEAISLSFEVGEDAAFDRQRVSAFVARHQLPYPVLLAGSIGELAKTLPQLIGLRDVPTTVFVGRDGHVAAIYEGFPSRATGIEHTLFRQETEQLLDHLLHRQPLDPELAVVQP